MSGDIRSHGRASRSRLCLTLCAMMAMAAACLPARQAQATDIRHWRREPIAISLPVGAERIVVFGRPVRVGLPPLIADPALLRVQSTGGAVYLKANKSFDTQRVQVQDIGSGKIILLDLSAKEHASAETIRVEIETDRPAAAMAGENAPTPTHQVRRPIPSAAFGHTGSGAPTPVRLVRHAAQALYAPLRLVDGAPGIHRIAVVAPDSLPGLLPAYPVDARPLAAWRAAPFTVTAIEITNRDPRRSFVLDPRGLAGDFYAAGFMHQSIGPAGSLRDTTTLFLVTENADLADALAPTVGAIAEADDGD